MTTDPEHTNIRIRRINKEIMEDLGRKGDTYDDILMWLLTYVALQIEDFQAFIRRQRGQE